MEKKKADCNKTKATAKTGAKGAKKVIPKKAAADKGVEKTSKDKIEKKPQEVVEQKNILKKKDPATVEIVNPEEIDDFYDFVNFSLEGTSYKTTINNKFSKRAKYELPNAKKIRAFIPGTIQKVYVKDGAKVKMKDKLLVLEAMKMKNVLIAPMAGVVKKVYVKQGAHVAKNEILVELK